MLPRMRYMSYVNLTRRSRCNSSSSRYGYRACGHVSTRPDPERPGAVDTYNSRTPHSPRKRWKDERAMPL